MPKDLYIVTAGPAETPAGPLFVSCVEPAAQGKDTLYTDSQEEVPGRVKKLHPRARYHFYPPLAAQAAESTPPHEVSDRLVSQLVDLHAAALYENVGEVAAFDALCRAAAALARLQLSTLKSTMYVATLQGAHVTQGDVFVFDPKGEHAELFKSIADLTCVVANTEPPRAAFLFFPGRGALHLLMKEGGWKRPLEGLLSFRALALPDWIARAAEAIGRAPVYPEPTLVSDDERLGLDDVDATTLAAISLALASGGEAEVNDVSVRLEVWRAPTLESESRPKRRAAKGRPT